MKLSQFQISQQMSDFDQTLYDLLPEEEQEEEHIPEPDLGEEVIYIYFMFQSGYSNKFA